MVEIFISGHRFAYEIRSLAMLFFPGVQLVVREGDGEKEGDYVYTGLHRRGEALELSCAVRWQGRETQLERPAPVADPAAKENLSALAQMEYTLLAQATGIQPAWGILTGIRPAKLVRSLGEKGYEEEGIRDYFVKDCLVAPEKAALAMDTEANARPFLNRLSTNSFSLYISIPFCPSRCAYCSFVSQSVETAGSLLPAYLRKLEEELAVTAATAAALGLVLRTVYIGGGTPTILTTEQLQELLACVRGCFDLDNIWEYTVEAGRPDTITPDKLETIRAGGGDRISINPQTLHQSVLSAIGRRHTVEDFYRAFDWARKAGFQRINADLIAALPGDTWEGFVESLKGIIDLGPENVTVHALSHKKSARLDKDILRGDASGLAAQMVDGSQEMLYASGYRPYYLYRQKNTLGNLENVGFCRPGYPGLYNILIMDESQTILAVGAGGVTKLKGVGAGKLQRIYNFKYPYEYLSQFDEILTRKHKIKEYWVNFI